MKIIQLLMMGILLTIPEVLDAQNSTVQWFALSGGFTSTSAQFGRMMAMSAGQSFVGISSGQSRIVESGFLTNPAFGSVSVVSVPVSSGWNMISNPLTRANDSVRMLFPTALSPYAFAFASGAGYVQQYRMTNGVGFWEKFPASITENVIGSSRLLDSIPVSGGWNMIGSISYPVDTSTIVTVPPGIRTSLYFGYNGGYTAAQVVVPGKAYWVKSSAAGKFALSSNFLAKPGLPSSMGFDQLNSITIADAEGGRQTLYFGDDVEGGFPVGVLEMPPPAPQGAFDARFESQKMVEIYNNKNDTESECRIVFQSSTYPITVSWNITGTNNRTFAVRDGIDGTFVRSAEVCGAGHLTITNPLVNRLILLVKNGAVPAKFSLQQNYPNPFNPTTTIRYQVPLTNHVLLKVFDVLGGEVRTLVNENLKPGSYEATFDAAGLASGVYFYKLEAGRFIETKKLLLIR